MTSDHILQIFLRVTIQNQIRVAQRIIVDAVSYTHLTDANAGEHGLLGAFFIASTHVLGHKGCHGPVSYTHLARKKAVVNGSQTTN